MKEAPRDLAASIRDRLRRHAEQRGRPFEEVLQYFGMERFLYRLSESRHARDFVLKGALLLHAWDLAGGRPTRDIDLRGYCPATAEAVASVVDEVCAAAVEPDGITFDRQSIRAEPIAAHATYPGVEARFIAHLGNTRIPMRLDVNASDSIYPDAIDLTYPTILPLPAPRLRSYPMESVVAEKLHATVVLGDVNSRMKDLYDIWLLAMHRDMEGEALRIAVQRTFSRRKTALPAPGWEDLLGRHARDKQDLWAGFRARMGGNLPSLSDVLGLIRVFLSTVVTAARTDPPCQLRWPPGGPWGAAKE